MALKGIPIILYEKEQSGVDAFNAPIYTEAPVTVKNVLICPMNTTDVVDALQLYGKKAEYELCIPKENRNVWEDRTVEFYGHKWRTFGIMLEWHAELTPGDWNRKIKVERYA